MEEFITATEASRRYHITDRTIRKHIKSGELPAKKIRINGLRQFAISTNDIEAFLTRHTATLPERIDTSISQRLQELEARVTELEHELHTLQQQAPRITPQREIETMALQTEQYTATPSHSRSAKSPLPPTWASWNNFLERHNLPVSSFNKHDFITNGKEYVQNGVTVKNPLDPAGQDALLRVGRVRYPDRYHQCEVRGCPCSES